MEVISSPSTARRLAAAFVTLIGGVIVLGWIFDNPLLKGALAQNIGVKANTGIAFLLSGLALGMTGLESDRARRLSRILATLILLIGGLTLSQHVIGWNLGIDQLFFHEAPGEIATVSPNRMGPPASISFTLAGFALFLLNLSIPRRPKAHDIASYLAVIIACIALLPILGYLYVARELYGSTRTGISITTAVSFMVLAIGILSACSEGHVVRLFVAPMAGGMLIRRLMLPAILLPPLLGYLRTIGETAGLFDAPVGRALLILSLVILFASMIWWSGVMLDRIDMARGQTAAYLGAIVESSDDAIVSKTLDGTVTSWNKGAQRVFEYAPDEMIGQSILRIIPPDRRQEEADIIARLRAGERVDHFQTVRMTRSGKHINISVTISPIKDATGRIVGASKVARDITDLKQREADREADLAAEHAARKSAEQAGRMKDEFLATLSHELRTPLSAILGWSQLLRRETRDDPQLQQGLDVIERNARIQTQLIEDLLDMSAIISGKLKMQVQSIDPAGFIDSAIETVRPAAQAKGIRLEKLLDPSAGPIWGDPSRLQQVVWNLLSNAIKFTPRDGKVQVVLKRVNSHVEITIADTGAGIKSDFLPHVFERFRQADSSTSRKHGGLGLGLAIVKHLVELHGGTISVNSPGAGEGTTFIVSLPLSVIHRDTSAAPDLDRSGAGSPSTFATLDLSGIKVLVVDDEPDARHLIRRVLEECAAKVVTASSASEAIRSVEHDRPDVLVSDIGMPEVDGYELLRQVRALGRARGGRIPAIALTAFARSEDRTRALRAGFLVHVAKPVEPSELIATVASVSGWSDEDDAETPGR